MAKISKRHIIAWYRFDDELSAFGETMEEAIIRRFKDKHTIL